MQRVILDTNFLLIPGYFGVDIIGEIERICGPCELCIIDKTQEEIQNILEKQKGKARFAAGLAQQVIDNNDFHIIPTEVDKDVDTLIIENSEDAIVATQDAGLKRRLREKGVRLIILRQKQYLQLV